MDDEALRVLAAIGEGAETGRPPAQRWIKAFKAIRWVVETANGPALTAEGRKARDEGLAERQGRPD